MKIAYHLDDGNDKITNFKVAEAVVDLCNDSHKSCNTLDAEIVAKMILLQTDILKGGVQE